MQPGPSRARCGERNSNTITLLKSKEEFSHKASWTTDVTRGTIRLLLTVVVALVSSITLRTSYDFGHVDPGITWNRFYCSRLSRRHYDVMD